jgi:hypothetical protein
LELEVQQRGQSGIDDKHHVASVTAIAPGRSALGAVLFATEADAAAPAVSGVHGNLRLVDESHGGGKLAATEIKEKIDRRARAASFSPSTASAAGVPQEAPPFPEGGPENLLQDG